MQGYHLLEPELSTRETENQRAISKKEGHFESQEEGMEKGGLNGFLVHSFGQHWARAKTEYIG